MHKSLILISKFPKEINMITTRFASLLAIIATALLVGCASPARVSGTVAHAGNHNLVAISGSGIIGDAGTNAVRPVTYAGQPGYMSGGPYPADRCPSGYRQFNGAYRCMDDYAGQPWQSWMGQQGHPYSHRPTIRYAAKCDFTDGDIQVYVEHQSTCDRLAAKMAKTKPGHCRVGGVNYPDLRDNESGCLAKHAEVTRQANAKTQAMQKQTASQTSGVWGYMPPTATPSNPQPCFVTRTVAGSRPGCSSVSVMLPKPGETRGAWEARAARGETFSN